MQQRRFHVTDIHCEGCQQTITNALGRVDGIGQIDPDQATNVVMVRFDDTVISVEAIAARLAAAGFPVARVDRAGEAADRPHTTALGEDASNHDRDARGAASRYGLLVATVLAIGVAGYSGYVLYPRFDLPAAQGAGLLGLAAAAGIASFFSPCSFPLLLGLLGRQARRQGASGHETSHPAVFGAALALGAALFMGVAGAVVGLGGGTLFAGITFTSIAGITIRVVVGLLLIFLGLMQIGRLPFSMHAVHDAARPLFRRAARLRREHPVAGYATFGFSYVLAGFG